MSEEPVREYRRQTAGRRSGVNRRKGERRVRDIPVGIERRKDGDRRSGGDRRSRGDRRSGVDRRTIRYT